MSIAPSLNETSTKIFTEKAFLQGVIVSGVAYGAQLPLFTMAFYIFWRKRSNTKSAMQNYASLVFISALFILGTLSIAADAEFTELSFIDDRNFPGGPAAFEEVEFTNPEDEYGNICAMLSTWLCDALLRPAYSGYNRHLGSSPWAGGATNCTITFFSLSLSLNIPLTIAIVSRLLLFRKHIVSILGNNHGHQYTSIAAMIVESASIFSAFSLLFLIPFALNHPLNYIFFRALSGVQIFATYLITFRTAQGKCWDVDTATVQRGLSSVRIMTPQANPSGTIVSPNGDRCIGVAALGKDRENAFVAFQRSSSHTAFEPVGHTDSAFDAGSDQDLEMATIPTKDSESQF